MTTTPPAAPAPPSSGHVAAAVAWAAVAFVVLAQLPAFLCLGLDSDISMYDVVARRVLRGDVHYRDLLETNFPGIVWLHMAFRSLFGWSPAALRAADLAIVAASAWLLTGWLPRSAPAWRRVALALVLLAYYLSTTEWCHCQRDVWMLLPALVALNLRAWQADRLAGGDAPPAALARWAFLEGAVWAVAFWIKPFVAVPGLACWLLSVRAARGTAGVAADLAGFLLGGLAVGAAGTAWLVMTGAWPGFLEVMFGWNREYFTHNIFGDGPMPYFRLFLLRNFPWVLAHLAAVPLAVAAVWRGGRGSAGVPALLGGLYLGWLLQAVLLQHPFDYVHAPPILLALAVVGTHGLGQERGQVAVPAVGLLAVCVALACPPLVAARAAAWGECVRAGSTPALRDRLTRLGRVRWADMEQVAEYLRRQQVGDGELTTFSLPTIPLYHDLDLRPSTRYLFLQDHLDIFVSRRQQILTALVASRQRFVVCDLERYGMSRMRAALDGPTAAYRWADRAVFRSGQYVVFRVDGGEMPAWLASHFGSEPCTSADCR